MALLYLNSLPKDPTSPNNTFPLVGMGRWKSNNSSLGGHKSASKNTLFFFFFFTLSPGSTVCTVYCTLRAHLILDWSPYECQWPAHGLWPSITQGTASSYPQLRSWFLGYQTAPRAPTLAKAPLSFLWACLLPTIT